MKEIEDGKEFAPKMSVKERYSLENMAKSKGMTVEEFLENNK